MKAQTKPPKTYLGHSGYWRFNRFLQQLLASPNLALIEDELAGYLQNHPLPLDDFPRLERTYSRTIIYRDESGYEVMAARWSRGTISAIHGHPYFNLYYVVNGCLKIDDYIRTDEGLVIAASGKMVERDVSCFIGQQGTFDNNIHQVQAIEETLSIHISSDDSTKGEVFNQQH